MSYRKITDLDDLSSNLGDSDSLDFFVGAVGGQLGKVDAAAMAKALGLDDLAETADAITELNDATSVAESVAEGLTDLSDVYSSLVESALYTDGTDEFANRIMERLGYGCLVYTTSEEDEEVLIAAMGNCLSNLYIDGKEVEFTYEESTTWGSAETSLGFTGYPVVYTFAEAGEHAVWMKLSASGFYLFRQCQALTAVRVSPFYKCTSATALTYLFGYCQALTTIPSGMFDTLTKVTSFLNCFISCYALQEIPDGLFDYCTAATTFQNCLDGCRALTKVPDGLLKNNTAVTNLTNFFSGCTSLVTANVDAQLDNATNLNTFFNGDTKLTELTLYNLGAQEECTTTNTFYNCTLWGSTDDGLTSLVDTLYTNSFDRATAGYEALSITIPEAVYNRLSDDEVSAIVAKGFTLATE